MNKGSLTCHPVNPKKNASNQFVLAGRGQRLAASLLDGLLVGILSMLLGFNFYLWDPNIAVEFLITSYLSHTIFKFFFMLVVLYLYIYIVFSNGQTWGKRILKIRVMNQDGSVCTQQHYFWKRTLLFVLLPQIIFVIDALMIFRESRRCWHDDFAKTMVVKVQND